MRGKKKKRFFDGTLMYGGVCWKVGELLWDLSQDVRARSEAVTHEARHRDASKEKNIFARAGKYSVRVASNHLND